MREWGSSEKIDDAYLARAAERFARQARHAADHGRTPEYYRALDALRKALEPATHKQP